MKRFLGFLCLTLLLFNIFFGCQKQVYANDLDDTINNQIEHIDLSEIEKIFDSNFGEHFRDKLVKIINGEYNLSFSDYFKEILNSFCISIKENVSFILSFIGVFIFIFILSNYLKENSEIKKMILYISNIAIITLLSVRIISIFKESISTLNSLSSLNEVLSPVLLTLIVTSGGSISATIFSPSTVFLSTLINTVCLKILFPIIILILVLSVISTFNNGIEINSFNDVLCSILKWVIGIISIIFTIILSIQGICAGLQDGLTLKATKYALSSSMPIIGGIVKDGFDFIRASSIIVKNSIGMLSIFLLFSIVLKCIIKLIAFNLILKLTSAVIIQFGDLKTNSICCSVSKAITYIIALVLMCALLLIIYIFLIIISANAFI